VKGKFGYMSPEQVMGDEELDARSDLFSLGVVLAEMLLGRRLFSGKGEFEVLTRMYEADLAVLDQESERLPPAIVELLRKALRKDRAQRFQTASEFLVALATVAQQLGVVLDEPSLVPWLFQLGVMPSQSGTYSLQIDPAQTNRRQNPFKR
jgi:serine/threonine-protein kinase